MVFLPLDDFYLTPPSTVRAWADAVGRLVDDVHVEVVEHQEDSARALVEADAAFGTLTPALLSATTRLRWLQAPAAAPPDGYFFDELVAHPAVVTNLRGVYRDNLADHVMAFVLGFARNLPSFASAQRQHHWRRDLGTAIGDLAATTMLLIGVGNVGAAVAHRARSFGIRLIGIDARPAEVTAPLDELHAPDRLDALLPDADWIVLTVPHTPETQNLIGRERLATMRSNAYLINVGRGETVDTDALVDALARGGLAGAALDVVHPEPLPAAHPLWDLPNVVLTPHVAGYGADTDGQREALIVENARRFSAGEPLHNVVDKQRRY